MMEIIPKEYVRPKNSIIEHHEKYKEIHGEDKTIFITISDHKLLHKRLRKEGKCNIPPEELHKISMNAYRRTEKYIESEKYQGYLEKVRERHRKKTEYDKIYEANIERQKILDELK